MANYDGKIRVGIDVDSKSIKSSFDTLNTSIKSVDKDIESISNELDDMFSVLGKGVSKSASFSSMFNGMIAKMHELSNEASAVQRGISSISPFADDFATKYPKNIQVVITELNALEAKFKVLQDVIRQTNSLGLTGIDITSGTESFIKEAQDVYKKIQESIYTFGDKESRSLYGGITPQESISRFINFDTDDSSDVSRKISDFAEELNIELSRHNLGLEFDFSGLNFEPIESNLKNGINAIQNIAKEAGVAFDKEINIKDFNYDVKTLDDSLAKLSSTSSALSNSSTLSEASKRSGVAELSKELERLKTVRDSISTDGIGLTDSLPKLESIDKKIESISRKLNEVKNKGFNDRVDEIISSASVKKAETDLEKLKRMGNELKLFNSENPFDNNTIARKLDELKAQAKKVKISLQFDFDKTQISNRLSEVKRAAEGIKFYVSTGNLVDARNNLESIKQEIDSLKSKRNELNKAFESGSIDKIKFIADTSEIDRTINELENTVVEIEADIKSSNKSGLSSLTSQVGSIKNLAGEIGKKFSLVTGVVKGTISAYKTLGKVSQFFTENLKEAVSRMKAVDTAIKDTVVSFAKLTKGAFGFMHDITSVIPVVSDLKENLNNIGFGDLVGADLLADAIREATGALKEFGESSLDEGSNFQAAYLRIKDTFGDARDEIYNFAKTSKDSLGMSETKYLEAAGKIGVFAHSYISDTEELAKVTNALAVSIADLSAQTGFSIDDTMEKVLSGLRGNTEAIEELGINVKVADMQNWLDTQGINAKFENLNSNMQNLYRTWYMLDKVATNGSIGYAAKMMNTFSGQVRLLQANLSALKTTLGTYLMQALVPVLKIINIVLSRLVDLANMIGKVFGLKDKYSLADSIGSADTSGFSDIYDEGKDAISGAVDEQNKLTDATNKTTAATNKAAAATNKAAAAAKKALAPFHKLNILSSNKDSDLGAGSGAGPGSGLGAGVNPGVGLGSALKVEKVDTSEADNIADAWLEALKEAIANEEWYAVGLLFAKKANEAISKIKSTLEKVQPYLVKWAKNIADILNGFVSGFDWDNLGSTVATAINTITSALLTFTKNVNWDKIGKGVSKFFKGLLRDTDWKAVGEFWTEKTRIFIEMLSGFVSDMSEIDPKSGLTGWEELGTSLAELVSGMINNIPWKTLGSTIAGALNGISDTVIKFTEEFNAGEEVGKIVEGINKALDEFDAHKFSTAASSLINEVLEALKVAVTETKWGELGNKIGTAIFGTLAKINWENVANTVGGGLDGALAFIDNFVGSLVQNQDKIKEGVTKVFNRVVSWLSSKENQETITTVVNGFVDALLNIFADQDWSGLYDAIGDILEGINWLDLAALIKLPDGIAESLKSTSAVSIVKGAFKSLFEGVAENISGIVESITGKFDELNTGLVTTFDNIKTSVSTKWEEIKTSIGTSVDNIKTSVSTKFEEIKTNLSKAWDDIKTSASTKWGEIKTSISGVVDSLKEGLSTKWEEIKTTLSKAWDNIKTAASDKWNEIKTSILTTVNNIKTSLEAKWNEIKTSVSTVWDNIKTAASDKWGAIKKSITGIVSDLKTNIESKWTTLKTNTLNVFKGIKDGVVDLFTNISTAIRNPINSIISLVESMVNKIIAGVNGAINTLNKFSVDVPDDVPVIGGKKWGFNISKLSSISIPRLANGAVIKPNQRFLAELGDQTRGINIETPLDTMLDAFRGALNDYNGTGDIIIPIYVNDELNSEEIIRRQDIARYRSNGK